MVKVTTQLKKCLNSFDHDCGLTEEVCCLVNRLLVTETHFVISCIMRSPLTFVRCLTKVPQQTKEQEIRKENLNQDVTTPDILRPAVKMGEK